MKQPSFCTIAPSAYLERYARYTGSKYHLILAHLLDSSSSHYNSAYTEFYKTSKQDGETYIMDNGAFELGASYAPDRLIETGLSVNADVLVLPDYPYCNWQVTVEAAQRTIVPFKQAGFKTFYVPQSEPGDWDGWMCSFEWGLFNPDIDIIGMSILAHPNALPAYPKGYARVVAADRIVQWLSANATRAAAFANKHIHWLGILSPGLEIPVLTKLGMVDTLDSSNPVWLGHCGIPYNKFAESWTPIDKQYVPEVDFGTHVNKRADTIIQHNLTLISSFFTK